MTEETVSIDIQPEPRSRMLGKWMSAAMVVGTMVGSGIYLLPTTVAPYGPNLVVAFIVTGLGTMCLAFALARLAAQIPGGPFVYVSQAFGETAAFLTLWSYMVSQWTGVAAVAIAAAGALGHVVPAVGSGPGLIAFALACIAVLLIVNLFGARSAGGLQVIATLIKILPLLIVVVLVVVRIAGGLELEALEPVPVAIPAITAAGALMLFSLTGFKSAAVVANVTRNSTKTVPVATIAGTGFTALLYLIATVATTDDPAERDRGEKQCTLRGRHRTGPRHRGRSIGRDYRGRQCLRHRQRSAVARGRNGTDHRWRARFAAVVPANQ